uniref:(northern house mosquito) hypothetical protein n=1 Tax=Culex pipiens TaxID=7175 RepID=A0A8D8N8I0_CULPI
MHQEDLHHREALRRPGRAARDLPQVQPEAVQPGVGPAPRQDFLGHHFEHLSELQQKARDGGDTAGGRQVPEQGQPGVVTESGELPFVGRDRVFVPVVATRRPDSGIAAQR